MCKVGASTIGMNAIAKLNRVVQDRDVAYSALLARLAGMHGAKVTAKEILAAERAVIALRFGGNRSSYVAALAKSRASVDVARGILADQLRERKIAARLRVPGPSAASIAGFYFSYPDLLVRTVEAAPSPWWLAGRRTGLALSSFAPERLFSLPAGQRANVSTLEGSFAVKPLDLPRPLGTVSFSHLRPTISAVLKQQARLEAAGRWLTARQSTLLNEATCRRDDLPQPALIALTDFLPLLELPG
jgi:hypothetical protein